MTRRRSQDPTEMGANQGEVRFDKNGQIILTRDRFLDPWRIAIRPAAEELVKQAVAIVEHAKLQTKPRGRKRRQADQRTFERTVEAISLDLAYAVLTGDDRESAVTRSNRILGKKSRYRPAAFNKTLPGILDLMASPQADLIEQDLGLKNPFATRHQQTLITAGPQLHNLIVKTGITPDDIGREKFEEIIILKAHKHDFWDNGMYMEYEDDDVTIRMRERLQAINDWMEAAAITIDYKSLLLPRELPTQPRKMRRFFTNGSFKSGGRLFGGFWQTLSKIDRLNALRINGEPVVELDYKQMAPRIVYSAIGVDPGPVDLYRIQGIDEKYREGIKTLMNAMLFTNEPLKRKPSGTAKDLPTYSITKLTQLVRDAHPDIASFFHSGEGHEAQYIESEIIMNVLERLKAKEIVGLQLHDAVIVPKSATKVTHQVMLDAFKDMCGIDIQVSILES